MKNNSITNKEKNRELIKNSALVIADQIVSSIQPLGIAWGLSKALFSNGLKLRQKRALEWVEMVRDNPNVFTKEVLEQESFQDGFVFALEKYIIERSEKKRIYFKKIFLGFAESDNKNEFELERFFLILSQLDENSIRNLGRVDIHTSNSYQIFDDTKAIESIYALVNAGILFVDPSARLGEIHSPFVYTTNFGRRFILYLSK